MITERGTLILSKLTGAADVLTETLQVNPFDIEEVSHAIQEALTTPLEKGVKNALLSSGSKLSRSMFTAGPRGS